MYNKGRMAFNIYQSIYDTCIFLTLLICFSYRETPVAASYLFHKSFFVELFNTTYHKEYDSLKNYNIINFLTKEIQYSLKIILKHI